MLPFGDYPLSSHRPIIFTGTPEQLDGSKDPRVRQFVEGKAGQRLNELRKEQGQKDYGPSTEMKDQENDHE